MDRLHVVIACSLVLLTSCDKEKAESTSPKTKSRVNAVAATAPAEAMSPEDFCDVYSAGDSGPNFEYPPLAGDAPASPDGWRWINVWATWCKPCVEEITRLAAWEKELSGELGDVVFLNADDSGEKVAAFRAEHPETPDGPRMSSPDDVNTWIVALGYDGPASLPVHVFVNPANHVSCIRVGGVSDRDRGAVERLLGD